MIAKAISEPYVDGCCKQQKRASTKLKAPKQITARAISVPYVENVRRSKSATGCSRALSFARALEYCCPEYVACLEKLRVEEVNEKGVKVGRVEVEPSGVRMPL